MHFSVPFSVLEFSVIQVGEEVGEEDTRKVLTYTFRRVFTLELEHIICVLAHMVAKRHSKMEDRTESGHKSSLRAGEDTDREASEEPPILLRQWTQLQCMNT